MIEFLAALFLTACGLLVIAGIDKAARPDSAVRALRAMGLPATPMLVRVGGGVEVALGSAAMIVHGWAISAAVTVSYAVFTAFVLVAFRRRTPLSTCGCFGIADTPPTLLHAAVTLLAAILAVTTILIRPTTLTGVLSNQPFYGVPMALLLVAVGYLAFQLLTWAARLQAERRQPPVLGSKPLGEVVR